MVKILSNSPITAYEDKLPNGTIRSKPGPTVPVDLHLIFEKLNSKNHVGQIGFLACKNQFRNLFLLATKAGKIKFKN